MPQFFASTSKGLVDVLSNELKQLGVTPTDKEVSGVYFESNWEGCYRVNLHSRLASRVMKPILDFVAYQPEELYAHVQRFDFTKFIRPNQTLMVDAKVVDCKLHDQRFVAMKIKDAIVDQFREKFDQRPDVDSKRADLRIQVKAVENKFSLSIDTSGDSLFLRGYRLEAGDAPMRENIAAGLLALSEWDKKSDFLDLFCGSGTILIEAALMACNIAPGTLRREFGFQKLLNYDSQIWDKIVNEAIESETETVETKFFGYDIDRQVLQKAKANARRAGVDHLIEFKREEVSTVAPPVGIGIIVSNPPFGARLGDEEQLRDVYRDLSYTLKNRFKGWTCWLLSGNKDLTTDLKLKANRRFQVFNGNLECRFLKYDMF